MSPPATQPPRRYRANEGLGHGRERHVEVVQHAELGLEPLPGNGGPAVRQRSDSVREPGEMPPLADTDAEPVQPLDVRPLAGAAVRAVDAAFPSAAFLAEDLREGGQALGHGPSLEQAARPGQQSPSSFGPQERLQEFPARSAVVPEPPDEPGPLGIPGRDASRVRGQEADGDVPIPDASDQAREAPESPNDLLGLEAGARGEQPGPDREPAREPPELLVETVDLFGARGGPREVAIELGLERGERPPQLIAQAYGAYGVAARLTGTRHRPPEGNTLVIGWGDRFRGRTPLPRRACPLPCHPRGRREAAGGPAAGPGRRPSA